MSRVMIIGYGPLPRSGMPYVSAPSLRTRHLLKPILDAKHTVNLYTLPLPGTEGPEGHVAAMMPDNYEGLAYQRFTNHNGEFAIRALTGQARQLKPDAIVGVNTYPSFVGARIASTVPLWADLNGYWMAEVQGQCAVDRDDARLEEAWAIERAIARRLDKFSAVSRPQLHAVLGEMAGIGRLNQYTFEYQFGHRIPNAAYKWEDAALEAGEPAPAVLRGPIVPGDAFIILWSGGFNVWCDAPMLVEAMNILMAQYPTVHFVSTGGRIEGVVSKPYQIFEDLVERSPYKDRFHLLGWVETDKLPRIYQEANLGINVDTKNYETMFGARNRLNAMGIEGLPMVSTVGTEISEVLEDGRALLGAPMGNAQALAGVIEPWIEQPEHLAIYAGNAQRIMKEVFNYGKTTRPLLHWLDAPELAPDNIEKIERTQGKLNDLNALALNSLEEQAMLLERTTAKDLQQSLAELETLKAKSRRRFLFGIK